MVRPKKSLWFKTSAVPQILGYLDNIQINNILAHWKKSKRPFLWAYVLQKITAFLLSKTFIIVILLAQRNIKLSKQVGLNIKHKTAAYPLKYNKKQKQNVRKANKHGKTQQFMLHKLEDKSPNNMHFHVQKTIKLMGIMKITMLYRN